MNFSVASTISGPLTVGDFISLVTFALVRCCNRATFALNPIIITSNNTYLEAERAVAIVVDAGEETARRLAHRRRLGHLVAALITARDRTVRHRTRIRRPLQSLRRFPATISLKIPSLTTEILATKFSSRQLFSS